MAAMPPLPAGVPADAAQGVLADLQTRLAGAGAAGDDVIVAAILQNPALCAALGVPQGTPSPERDAAVSECTPVLGGSQAPVCAAAGGGVLLPALPAVEIPRLPLGGPSPDDAPQQLMSPPLEVESGAPVATTPPAAECRPTGPSAAEGTGTVESILSAAAREEDGAAGAATASEACAGDPPASCRERTISPADDGRGAAAPAQFVTIFSTEGGCVVSPVRARQSPSRSPSPVGAAAAALHVLEGDVDDLMLATILQGGAAAAATPAAAATGVSPAEADDEVILREILRQEQAAGGPGTAAGLSERAPSTDLAWRQRVPSRLGTTAGSSCDALPPSKQHGMSSTCTSPVQHGLTLSSVPTSSLRATASEQPLPTPRPPDVPKRRRSKPPAMDVLAAEADVAAAVAAVGKMATPGQTPRSAATPRSDFGRRVGLSAERRRSASLAFQTSLAQLSSKGARPEGALSSGYAATEASASMYFPEESNVGASFVSFGSGGAFEPGIPAERVTSVQQDAPVGQPEGAGGVDVDANAQKKLIADVVTATLETLGVTPPSLSAADETLPAPGSPDSLPSVPRTLSANRSTGLELQELLHSAHAALRTSSGLTAHGVRTLSSARAKAGDRPLTPSTADDTVSVSSVTPPSPPPLSQEVAAPREEVPAEGGAACAGAPPSTSPLSEDSNPPPAPTSVSSVRCERRARPLESPPRPLIRHANGRVTPTLSPARVRTAQSPGAGLGRPLLSPPVAGDPSDAQSAASTSAPPSPPMTTASPQSRASALPFAAASTRPPSSAASKQSTPKSCIGAALRTASIPSYGARSTADAATETDAPAEGHETDVLQGIYAAIAKLAGRDAVAASSLPSQPASLPARSVAEVETPSAGQSAEGGEGEGASCGTQPEDEEEEAGEESGDELPEEDTADLPAAAPSATDMTEIMSVSALTASPRPPADAPQEAPQETLSSPFDDSRVRVKGRARQSTYTVGYGAVPVVHPTRSASSPPALGALPRIPSISQPPAELEAMASPPNPGTGGDVLDLLAKLAASPPPTYPGSTEADEPMHALPTLLYGAPSLPGGTVPPPALMPKKVTSPADGGVDVLPTPPRVRAVDHSPEAVSPRASHAFVNSPVDIVPSPPRQQAPPPLPSVPPTPPPTTPAQVIEAAAPAPPKDTTPAPSATTTPIDVSGRLHPHPRYVDPPLMQQTPTSFTYVTTAVDVVASAGLHSYAPPARPTPTRATFARHGGERGRDAWRNRSKRTPSAEAAAAAAVRAAPRRGSPPPPPPRDDTQTSIHAAVERINRALLRTPEKDVEKAVGLAVRVISSTQGRAEAAVWRGRSKTPEMEAEAKPGSERAASVSLDDDTPHRNPGVSRQRVRREQSRSQSREAGGLQSPLPPSVSRYYSPDCRDRTAATPTPDAVPAPALPAYKRVPFVTGVKAGKLISPEMPPSPQPAPLPRAASKSAEPARAADSQLNGLYRQFLDKPPQPTRRDGSVLRSPLPPDDGDRPARRRSATVDPAPAYASVHAGGVPTTPTPQRGDMGYALPCSPGCAASPETLPSPGTPPSHPAPGHVPTTPLPTSAAVTSSVAVRSRSSVGSADEASDLEMLGTTVPVNSPGLERVRRVTSEGGSTQADTPHARGRLARRPPALDRVPSAGTQLRQVHMPSLEEFLKAGGEVEDWVARLAGGSFTSKPSTPGSVSAAKFSESPEHAGPTRPRRATEVVHEAEAVLSMYRRHGRDGLGDHGAPLSDSLPSPAHGLHASDTL